MDFAAIMAAHELAPRGVHIARCLNEHGGLIMFAVNHKHCLLPRSLGSVREIAPGENPLPVHEEMWDLLNQLDPLPHDQTNGHAA